MKKLIAIIILISMGFSLDLYYENKQETKVFHDYIIKQAAKKKIYKKAGIVIAGITIETICILKLLKRI